MHVRYLWNFTEFDVRQLNTEIVDQFIFKSWTMGILMMTNKKFLVMNFHQSHY